ncbi:SMI1/KNR4 family protein [Chitinophaga silvisoli]|uniref:SMI1/KNR4 family protein n=1 Tax=Chitinophaga silvisoli TaxID=2291814 RepID=A0A3E1NKR1_9BACT|nr:SMI1/KNR4 family protein [Chitinophaga silvisoli]RFM28378.1 SMI1/KNR4 family protein [Chitinophaga silvisoli]
MFEIERKIMIEKVGEKEFESNSIASEHELETFESIYRDKLPVDLRAFYLELNGYYNSNDMVYLYPLKEVKKLKEYNFISSENEFNMDCFVIGDYGFQAIYWLLDMNTTKYFALSIANNMIVEVADSMKNLLCGLLKDSLTMIGLDAYE